jgi:hypothetical protein
MTERRALSNQQGVLRNVSFKLQVHGFFFVRTLNFTAGLLDLLTMGELLLRRRRSKRASEEKRGAINRAMIPIRIKPPINQRAGLSKSTNVFQINSFTGSRSSNRYCGRPL